VPSNETKGRKGLTRIGGERIETKSKKQVWQRSYREKGKENVHQGGSEGGKKHRRLTLLRLSQSKEVALISRQVCC